MITRLILINFILLLFIPTSFAESIHFKNGKKVLGNIVERNNRIIKVSVSGVMLTYDMKEVDRIEATSQETRYSSDETDASLPSQEVSSHTISEQSDIESQDDKEELILRLIEASGTRANMRQMFAQIISEAPPEESARLKEVFDVQEVISQLVPIYDSYFSTEEVKELIAFYRSKTGRKLLKVMPLIMEDSLKVSTLYFKEKISD